MKQETREALAPILVIGWVVWLAIALPVYLGWIGLCWCWLRLKEIRK